MVSVAGETGDDRVGEDRASTMTGMD